jgi:AcrR family transcriptional regulator
MARPLLTRDKILAAARRVVERDGAGALTFDELVKESGFTRGGITYHFPTKEDLLGFIRTLTAQDESHRRFLCGMLSAATLDPSLMDPCRQELRERLGRKQWSERDLRLHLIHLAAEGLMWQELFQMYSMPGPARTRLVALMQELARQWGAGQSPKKIAKEA